MVLWLVFRLLYHCYNGTSCGTTLVLWLVAALAPNAESQHKASVGTQVAYQTVDGDDDKNDYHDYNHDHDEKA